MRYSSLLALLFALPFPHHVYAFPQYGSLAGLTAKQLALVLPTLHTRPIIPPPGPLNDTSTKLVNDHQHPYIPPGPSDIRGPCPAMNTLANHGVSIEIRRFRNN
jgi:unspecific peroxygenase